jgi:hypothetical protein
MILRKDLPNISILAIILAAAYLFIGMVSPVLAEPWVACGQLTDINPVTCQITGRPLTRYEYGIAYNTKEPVPVVCTFWNVGARIANKTPYLVDSDNPLAGMAYGGFVFYQNTAAPDDDACGSGGYRHHYWRLTEDNRVEVFFGSNGCFSTEQRVFCRLR